MLLVYVDVWIAIKQHTNNYEMSSNQINEYGSVSLGYESDRTVSAPSSPRSAGHHEEEEVVAVVVADAPKTKTKTIKPKAAPKTKTPKTKTYYLRQGPANIEIIATSLLQALATAYELTGKDRWTLERIGS